MSISFSFYDSSSSVPLSPSPLSPRLLLPTVRNPRSILPSVPSPPLPYKSPKIRSAAYRSTRSRLASPPIPSDPRDPSATIGQLWLGLDKDANFEIVHDQLELDGFQLFAVEKWVTERTRPIVSLIVYTGDPLHKITVTALSPSHTLRPEAAKAEWDRAIRDLRQAGARPRDTEHGTIMVTSLANFRSDYTIVPIPSGFFLEARDRLYTNINVLRIGCCGRMALTLEEPRQAHDTTKDRFIAMYRMSDKIRSSALFGTTILELVRLIQAALSLFGMFSLCQDERDGLLCDLTVDGIQRWVTEIGESHMGVEPTERVADPVVVCALLSQVSDVRNKLSALGFVTPQLIPQDPFLDPQRFLRAISAFQDSRLFSSSSPSNQLLTDDVLNAIDTAYSKSRTTEPYKVHRVLLNKLDDLTTDLRTSSGPTNINPTDIDQFVFYAETKAAKDGVPCLKHLWSGRAEMLAVKRKDRLWSDVESDNGRDREGKERADKTDEFPVSDENELSRAWRGKRVQRKIESWAGLSRQMKRSIDAGLKSHRSLLVNDSPSGSRASPSIPEVVVTRSDGEEDEVLSSGQVSPISHSPGYRLGTAPSAADISASNLSEYERRVSEFNKIWPERPPAGFRVTSWPDRRNDGSPRSGYQRHGGSYNHVHDGTAKESTYRSSGKGIRGKKGTYRTTAIGRRRSFDDASKLTRSRVLPVNRMKIDVELCGQLLVMRRREQHLDGVVACLHILTSRLSQMNAYLREDHEAHQAGLSSAESRVKIIAEIEGARDKAYTMLQETQALSYEAAQFHLPGLLNTVVPQRQKVFEMRSRVFDTGRRAPGAGRFNRVLWTLDGQETYVDREGRTEEEAIEEHGLDGMQSVEEEEENEENEQEAEPKPPPSWLLKMIASWGSRWGPGRKRADDTATKGTPIVDGDKRTLSSPSESGALSPVLEPLAQNPGESVVLTHGQ
ncbi:hypothetical protein F5148DRAFT_1008388 [Russula earlei]|uniref:Uncharacterized protein n=1 Tax=Russula earlei TaxID=71964 RepID=A0ACC0UM50_9AGAM|nr:hypothetical protein F5148DRAFT_1008388 [Russula earlei]